MNGAGTLAALGLSGACFGIIGLVAIQRLGIGIRVRYVDGRYLVAVRYPGEWHELREFVQPFDPSVVGAHADTWSCLDWVCRNIRYKEDVGEFWQFPSETLATREDDCEEHAFLLVSMLRSFTNAYVVLGDYQGWGHAWGASEEGEILEATCTEARAVPDPEAYHPYVLFNDQEVIEMWPGALREVFQLRRNKAAKLSLMASVP
jgi:hypothetical protein